MAEQARKFKHTMLVYNSGMDDLILDIATHIDSAPGQTIEPDELAGIIRSHNAGIRDVSQHFSKKKLYPYFLRMQAEVPDYWRSRGISEDTERLLIKALQMKPRRTASGVATITVITKPWKCGGNCVFCPNDIRMPKSYLHDEPACQRAERNFFDPYLQVASRLKALIEMGHPTDKVELIILGGTWCDYPHEYQTWYVSRLFEALNDGSEAIEQAPMIRNQYKELGFNNGRTALQEHVAAVQKRIDSGLISYNDAWDEIYGSSDLWNELASTQQADFARLDSAHRTNETAAHRVVGLVIETRPDRITPERCALLRRFGCTKLQMGVQSLQAEVQEKCGRTFNKEALARAFSLVRLFGFKIHAHFMVNLPSSTPEADMTDYRRFVEEPAWLPDEVKLYPTVMVKGTHLCDMRDCEEWQPYSEDVLIDILVEDVFATPTFMRISRMIRDISATDIIAGNKKTNLRQMVEQRVQAISDETGCTVREIRFREISTSETSVSQLEYDEFTYETASTKEYFLQWKTPENRIAGFLRLSLPFPNKLSQLTNSRPASDRLASDQLTETSIDIAEDGYPCEGEAMIREVHIYGHAAQLHKESTGAQHQGLGRRLVERACEIAREEGYSALNVISSVGTREYYRKLGFEDLPLYQKRTL